MSKIRLRKVGESQEEWFDRLRRERAAPLTYDEREYKNWLAQHAHMLGYTDDRAEEQFVAYARKFGFTDEGIAYGGRFEGCCGDLREAFMAGYAAAKGEKK